MKKENILVIVLVLIAFAGIMVYNNSKSDEKNDFAIEKAAAQTIEAAAIEWQDYTQGMALAKKQGKHIFLYFHADWCTYCRKLEATTFQDKKVKTYLKDNFIAISVDTDKETALSTEWKVRGLPTLWFLKPDNSKISSMPGYVDEKQFLDILKYIHTKSYDRMTFHEFMKTR